MKSKIVIAVVMVAFGCKAALAEQAANVASVQADTKMPALSTSNENANVGTIEQKSAIGDLLLTKPAAPPRDTMYKIGRDGSGPSLGGQPDGIVISRPDPIAGPAAGTIPQPNEAGPAPVDLNEKTLPPGAIGKPVVPGPIVDPVRTTPPLDPWQPTPITGVVFPKATVKAGDITVTSDTKTLTVEFNGMATDRSNDVYTLDLAQGTITVIHYSSGWPTGKPTRSGRVVSIKDGEAFIAALKAMMAHVDSAIASTKTGHRSLGQIKMALHRVYRIATRRPFRDVVVIKDPPVPTPMQTPQTTSYFGNRDNIQGGPSVAAVDNASH